MSSGGTIWGTGILTTRPNACSKFDYFRPGSSEVTSAAIIQGPRSEKCALQKISVLLHPVSREAQVQIRRGKSQVPCGFKDPEAFQTCDLGMPRAD